MNKKISPLACLAAASCLFSAVCLYKISTLENQLQALQNNTSNQLNNLQDNVSGIYGQVQSALEEQASLLSLAETQYARLDPDSRQAWVSCTVCPKEYTPGVTQVFAVLNGQRYPLELAEDAYTGEVPLPLFSESHIDTVLLVEGDTVRSQTVDWYFCPRQDYLPSIYLSFSGDDGGSSQNGQFTQQVKGLLTAEIYAADSVAVEQMDVVALLDGEEIWRTAADLSYEGQKGYLDAYNENRSSAIAMPSPEDFTAGKGGSLYCYLDQSWQIPAGSSLQLYAEITDQSGLHYWALAGAYAVDEQGSFDIQHELDNLECSIYDSQGQLLWKADDGLFR